MKLFCLGLCLFFTTSARAASFEDLLGAPNDVTTIDPVNYKGLPLQSNGSKAVCLLAGYQFVSNVEVRPLNNGEKYYSLHGLEAAGMPFEFHLETARRYTNDNGLTYYTNDALVRVTCRKRLSP
jgi:hypothetical protein